MTRRTAGRPARHATGHEATGHLYRSRRTARSARGKAALSWLLAFIDMAAILLPTICFIAATIVVGGLRIWF